ncbi:MAG: cysteine desulfurase NifS, partial [Candidatus Dadabacteria bacterium]|nr:cysteine desulfurase NifS [Candidatus Dadabacteria bacterium]
VNADPSHRVCNTSNIRFSGIDGMALMAQLDREGVICSQTSACKSQRPEPSHVLLAMGLSEEEAFASVRFSFSVLNTDEDAVAAADRVVDSYRKLLAFRSQEV